MENERKSIRIGLAVILCAAVLRLIAGGALAPLGRLLNGETVTAALLYLESGRVVYKQPVVGETPKQTRPAPQTQPQTREPVLEPGDGAYVEIINYTSLEPDLEALMWESDFPELVSSEPTVLIVHTHGSESYLCQAGYVESSPYRTHDNGYNMVSIGDVVATRLRQAGIGVIHDTTLHDVPDYNGAYASARSAVKEYLKQYPSIRLVLDLHRDANGDYVNQLTTGALVEGQASAQLMMVVGTDHVLWQQNMSCAVQLHALLEKTSPGICRAISFRGGVFNQDLLPAMLLVEVGAAGDTHARAEVAAQALADAIIALSDN